MPTDINRRDAARAEINNLLFFRLFQATNTMHTKATKAVNCLGVTSQQWSVLGALSRPQAELGMSVGELSEYLLISRQNLAGLLGRLEREGHLQRVACEVDGRSRRVRLTPKGKRLWQALDPLIYSFYDAALHGFSFENRITFLHLLNQLQRNMRGL